MSEKPKPKFGWRLLRWGAIGAAVIVTLAAMLVTEENWRGKRAWAAYKLAAEARGERLDMASVIPASVPDNQNFFCAPTVANTLRHSNDEDADRSTQATSRMNFQIYRGDSKLWPTNGGDWQKGKLIDLREWQAYFKNYNATPEGRTNGFPTAAQPQTPAADVLLALSVYDPALAELRAASQRPYARIPLNYENGFEAASELLPWLAKMKGCAQFLQLRITAELEDGQSAAALDDVKLLTCVTDYVREQPFLISHLVRIAMMSLNLQPIYTGLAQHRWSDDQLKELEELLARQDFLADFTYSMRGEKIFAIDTFEKQRITRETRQVEEHGGTNRIVTVSLRWMPKAYFYQNQLNFARLNEEVVLPLIDATNRLVFPARLRETQTNVAAQKKHYSIYKVQALMVFPALAASVKKFAVIQAQVDLARVACALERYRLAHNEYPASLDALTPTFITDLPHDLINGQPLHYRRTADGKFVLYSVGWNETDDGGVTVFRKSGSVDLEKGDWVWRN